MGYSTWKNEKNQAKDYGEQANQEDTAEFSLYRIIKARNPD
jgi:hypothetical protein